MNDIDKLELKQLLDARDEHLLKSLEYLLDRGMKSVMVSAGIVKTHILKQEAARRYGRWTIEKWIRQGHLRQVKDGDSKSARCRICVEELERVAAQFNHPSKVKGKIRTRRTKTGVDYPQNQ